MWHQMSEIPLLTDISQNWEAENLRSTTFLKTEADIGNKESWWHSVVGDEPERSDSRPKAGTIRQTGPLDGKRLSLAVQPGRVDWNLSEQLESPEELGDRLPTIGLFAAAYGSFSTVQEHWFETCPEVARIAFGAILDIPVADRIEGYRIISRFLPNMPIDIENSIDFLYQINRPRMSNIIEGLSINRLMKWAVVRTGVVRFDVGSDGRALSTNLPVQSACRLELDISTTAEWSGDLPRESLYAIFEEMVNLGKEIAMNGDIA